MGDTVPQELVDLATSDAEALAGAGSKAATLGRMRQAGLPVPEGAVVAPHTEPDAAAAALRAQLGEQLFAVRSSAWVEDLVDQSFAGRYRTRLRVPADHLQVAIVDVRASAADVAEASDGPIPVLVMPMIAARCAGVAFSADPVSGDRDSVVIEAVTGTAENLVAGTVTPQRWRVGRHGVEGSGEILNKEKLAGVTELARRASGVLGCPADIEWAHDGERLWLLQARPITGLPHPFIAPGDLPPGTWERETVHFWNPLPPLSASVLLPPSDQGLTRTQQLLGGPIERFESRAVNWYVYGRALPIGVPEKALAKGGGPPPALVVGLLARLHPRLRARERAARRWLVEDQTGRTLTARTKGLPPELVERVARLRRVDPDALDQAALRDHLQDAIDLYRDAWAEHGRYIAASSTALGSYGSAVTAQLGWSPADAVELLAGHGTSTAQRGARLREVVAAVAADPQARDAVRAGSIDALLEGTGPGARAVRDYVEEHALIPLWVDLAAPTISEDHDHLLATLRQELTEAPAVEPSARAAELEQQLRSHANSQRLLALLRRARATHAIRDAQSLPMFHSAGLIRRAALVAGRRLVEAGHADEPGDVMFYERDELLAWLDGGAHQKAEILRERRESLERAQRMVAPAFIGPPPSPPPSPRFLPPAMRRTVTWAMFTIEIMFGARGGQPADGALTGTPASPGQVRGRARRVDDPADIARVEPGDVLVCGMTTPAWVGAFLRAAAVVTESGGMLSHPAILAREHGLPAVVGVADARRLIRDGSMVSVDGTRGVIVVEPPDAA